MRCAVDGCRNGAHSDGLCSVHLELWRGSPEHGRAMSQLADFARRIESEGRNATPKASRNGVESDQ